MKVLHVAASLAPEWGGPVEVIAQLTSALKSHGVSSEVMAARGRRVGTPEANPYEIPTHLFDTGPLSRFWTGHAPGLRRALSPKLNEFDVVHIHELWHYPGYVASRVARTAGAPYVVTIHGALNGPSLNQKWLKKRIYRAAVQDRVLGEATILHALNAAEADRIHELGFKSPVRTVANGIFAVDFDDPPDAVRFFDRHPEISGKRLVLFLGRIHRTKRLDILARAFGILARSRNDVALVIAGPDEDGTLTEVKSLLKSAGVLPNAVFPGMLVGERKHEALSAADVFALTSQSEGFSMSLLEALAAGLPSVVTPGCNFPEIESAGAGFVVTSDAKKVADKLTALFQDPGLRDAMGVNAKRLVRADYTWDRIAGEMLELYETALGARRHRDGQPL